MLDTFDIGPIHMDVNTETGELHIRWATNGFYSAEIARDLADFLCKHYQEPLDHEPKKKQKK